MSVNKDIPRMKTLQYGRLVCRRIILGHPWKRPPDDVYEAHFVRNRIQAFDEELNAQTAGRIAHHGICNQQKNWVSSRVNLMPKWHKS
jgi:hypothetical protein